ncbi:MAG: Aldose 1-epimerase [Gemmatimonadetes bacterium]|nr:Aldose 1-epimerase [Gemmatimonadota bacterium]
MSACVRREPFGTLPGGEAVEAFALANAGGMEVRVTGYGGTILSVCVPDRHGVMGDVVLGYDTLAEYVAGDAYFGALIGRCANRIARGRFTLDGREHVLPVNDGPNHLHGGPLGFHKVLWTVSVFPADEGCGVRLAYTSADGEQGYPGELRARVTYTLTDADELVVDYLAEADRPTPAKLTQHTYWNLSANPARDVLAHELALQADAITPVDPTLIPTGELAPVEGTAFDFRRPTPIGARIGWSDEQLARAGGYDHNFVLRGGGGPLAVAAHVRDPGSGRTLTVLTTEPGMQFYSGNFLDGTTRGKGGQPHGYRSGLCLEPQGFPDSPNHPSFPSVILRPGEELRSRTVYRFRVE